MSENLISLSSLRRFPIQTSEATAAQTSSATAGSASGDSKKLESAGENFKQILSALVLGMAAPGGSGETNPAGALMMPLMLSLLEQLLAKETEEAESAEQVEEAGQVEEVEEALSTGDGLIPSGMPIKGRLTQSSHAGHVALDFGAPVGTPVRATMDGKVVYAGWNNQGYGNLIIVENGPYRTYYAHLSKIPVEVGQKVTARDVIGYSGNTGNSTGPHLHYEVRRNMRQLDPAKFVRA